MPTNVTDLKFTLASIDKLGARNISEMEVTEVPWNRYVVVHNPHGRGPGRRFLIGRTHGARALTLVISPTDDPTTWLVITGWESTPRERKILYR